MRRKLNPIPIFDREIFLEELNKLNIKSLVNANKIWRYIWRNYEILDGNININDIPGVNKKAKELILNNKFCILSSKIKEAHTSKDGTTTKLIIVLQDGSEIESVIIRHEKSSERSNRRVTLCVSSQIGCKMGCTFCATGTMGLIGHMTSGEIFEQLIHASRYETIRNVVFMGMGEPLDNYNSVISAVKTMMDNGLCALSPTRITISTVGVAHNIRKMVNDIPTLSLAISLHAPTQELRQKIVPTAKGWKLDKLMNALDYYLENCKQTKALIEYILIGNVNDSDETARLLGDLLAKRPVLVNLIPYNPTDVDANFSPPTQEQVERFHNILRNEYSIPTTVRITMGDDIAGACGQLVKKNQQKLIDIEDIGRKSKNIKKKFKQTKLNNNNNKKKKKSKKTIHLSMYLYVAAFLLLILAICLYKFYKN